MRKNFTVTLAFLVTILALALVGFQYRAYMNTPVTNFYGSWIEQDVPAYLAETFEIREEGVFINGSIVTTDFDVTRDSLSFTIGDKTYRFSAIDQFTILREAPAITPATFSGRGQSR